MLTGRRAFGGQTGADSLSAILKDDPPNVAELVPQVPASVARVVHHCLAKSGEQRFHCGRDIALALAVAAASSTQPVPAAVGRRRWFMVAAVALVAALVGAAIIARLQSTPPAQPRRVTISAPAAAPFSRDVYVPFALSPDGAVVAHTSSQPEYLFVRRLDDFESTRLAGTEGAFDPFFSPDKQSLGFWAFGQIKTIAVAGGPTVVVCQTPDLLGASWGEDGNIVFAPGSGAGLSIVSASGGTPKVLTTPDVSRNEIQHVFPQVIDHGRSVLFTATARSKESPYSIEVVDTQTRSRRSLVPGAHYGRYLPSGHLLFVRERTLFAMKVTPGTLAPAGPAVAVVREVQARSEGQALYTVATDGTLIYAPALSRPEMALVWVDRTGAVTDTGLPVRPYFAPRVAPDGRSIAVNIGDAAEGADIWISATDRPTLERLTFGRRLAWSFAAVAFSADSREVVYAEDGEGGARLVMQARDRSRPSRELLTSKLAVAPSRWLSTGAAMLVSARGADTGGDLVIVDSSSGRATPFVQEPGNQFGGTPSPDGRYVAYASDETGRFEVFVTPFPGPAPKRQLTTEGATEPVWSPRGNEIYYRSGDRLMVIPVTTTPSLAVGPARRLFEGRFARGSAGLPEYDVGADGRFLMMRPMGDAPELELRIVFNWLAELERLVP
jgi:serine/threonine-protein kinase